MNSTTKSTFSAGEGEYSDMTWNDIKHAMSLCSGPTMMEDVYDADIGHFTVDLSRWTVKEVKAEIEYYNNRHIETEVWYIDDEDNVANCIKRWSFCGERCHCAETSQTEPETWLCDGCYENFCVLCTNEKPMECTHCGYGGGEDV